MRYRAWGNGFWWTPLKDGWLSAPNGIYRWRGPVADVNGPAPDGANPQSSSHDSASAPLPPELSDKTSSTAVTLNQLD